MSLGPWEIIAILVVIVLLFGAKKLPDAARSLGRSMRIFKSEVKEMKHDDEQPEVPEQQAIQQAPDFWNSPENQPRQIEQQQANYQQQPPVQNPNYQQQPKQNNQ